MSSDDVKQVFEDTTQRMLQASVNAAGDCYDEVSDIWIYLSMDDGGLGLSKTLYTVDGQTVASQDLDKHVSTKVGSGTVEFQMQLTGEVSDAFDELIEGYDDNPDVPRPSRIVVQYQTKAERMDATFSYRRLSDDTADPVVVFDRWLANAQRTGDHTADATTLPE